MTTTIQPGNRVRFRFGCTDVDLFGTVQRLCIDRQGRAAAVINVEGFPTWRHVEPLADVHPAPRPAFLARISGRVAA